MAAIESEIEAGFSFSEGTRSRRPNSINIRTFDKTFQSMTETSKICLIGNLTDVMKCAELQD